MSKKNLITKKEKKNQNSFLGISDELLTEFIRRNFSAIHLLKKMDKKYQAKNFLTAHFCSFDRKKNHSCWAILLFRIKKQTESTYIRLYRADIVDMLRDHPKKKKPFSPDAVSTNYFLTLRDALSYGRSEGLSNVETVRMIRQNKIFIGKPPKKSDFTIRLRKNRYYYIPS